MPVRSIYLTDNEYTTLTIEAHRQKVTVGVVISKIVKSACKKIVEDNKAKEEILKNDE